MNREAIGKLLRAAFAKGFKDLPKDVQRGFRTRHMRRAGDSLFMAPLESVAMKLLKGKGRKGLPNIRGTRKVKNFMWDKIQKPSLMADIAAGKVLNKVTKNLTPMDNLFKVKEKVPVGKGMFREVERHSGLAPLTKAVGIASPFVLGTWSQEQLEKLHGQRGNKKTL